RLSPVMKIDRVVDAVEAECTAQAPFDPCGAVQQVAVEGLARRVFGNSASPLVELPIADQAGKVRPRIRWVDAAAIAARAPIEAPVGLVTISARVVDGAHQAARRRKDKAGEKGRSMPWHDSALHCAPMVGAVPLDPDERGPTKGPPRPSFGP